MTIMKRSFLLTLITLSLIFSSFPTTNTVSANGDFFSKKTEKSLAKLGPSLSSTLNQETINIKGLERVKKDTERLHVYVEFSHPSVIDALGKLGEFKNLNEEYRLAEMFLPAKAIKGLLNHPHVVSIREVMKPVVNRGSRTTEGFENTNGHGVESYLRTHDFAGDDIKIGVISDGVAGLAEAIASGDLPSNVVVLNNRFNGAEGTAMLEIIYDLAPNAQLFFHDYGSSSLDFIDAINTLAAQGVDIIIDDIVYLDEPFYEDSIIAKHIDQLVASTGILYVSSAGNFAESHYQGNYLPILQNGVYEHDFSSVDPKINRIPVNIAARSSVIIMLQWNEPFDNSAKDLELAVCPDETSTDCFVSDNWQLGAGYSPVEYVELFNSSYQSQMQYIAVFSETALTNVNMEIYVFGNISIAKYGTRSDSTFGHSTAASVLSIASTSDGFSVQSNYSSQGPFTMVNGTKRNKPDFIGRDCVMVTGFGGFPTNFCGTSAAAPHIGAIAGLMLSNDQSLSRAQLINALKAKSVDMDVTGYDHKTGNGFIHVGLFSNDITLQKDQISNFTITLDKEGTFTSDNPAVLSITSVQTETKHIVDTYYYTYNVSIKALAYGIANLRFTANDAKVMYRRKYVVSDRLVDFKIDSSDNLYLPLNHTLPLDLTIYPANADNATFTFSSSDPTVATVDGFGNVTTLSAGTTRIKATHTATGLSDTRTIFTGILSTELNVTPQQPTIMGINQTVQLVASFTPADTTFTNVHWYCLDDWYATVDQNGLVTGLKQGEVIIRAVSQDGQSFKDTVVKIIKPLTSISFDSPTYTVYYEGKFFTKFLSLNKTPYDSIESGLVWESSNPEVMEVDQVGFITYKALGTSEITVSGPRGLFASTVISFEPYPYKIGFDVSRNGTFVQKAYEIIGTYGSSISIEDLKAHYHQTIGITPGHDVNFSWYSSYYGTTPQTFGLISDYAFDANETLLATEYPIDIKAIKITDVSIDQNTLHVNGRFEPERPIDIRYRYIISDLSVLKPIAGSDSAMCTESDVEFACTPGSFEILKAGSVNVTVESFDGTFKDTIRVNITGVTNSYQINDKAVQSLRINSYNSSTLELHWSEVVGALGYEVYRSMTLGGTYVKIADVDSAQLTYLDGGRTLNQPTYYKVAAKLLINDVEVNGPSSAAMEGRTKPDPITNATITSESGTKLKMAVNVSAQNAVIQWAYARHPDGPFTIMEESTQQIASLADLHPGQTYYFKVRYTRDSAYGRITSDYSSVYTAKPIPLPPGVTAYSISPTQIRVEVNSPENVHLFHLIRYVNGVQDIQMQSQQHTYFDFYDLKEGDQVTFKAYLSLRVNNQSVDSPFSQIINTVKGVTLAKQIVGSGGTLKLKVNGVEFTQAIVPAGENITVEALPHSGYRVYRWIINNETLNHRNNVLTLENIQANTTISVEFVMVGDLNNDNQVSATDLVTMRRYLAGLTDIIDKGKVGGDIDNNGTVSTTDLVRLRRRLAGLE
jgi:uncharacterized protein YjdB